MGWVAVAAASVPRLKTLAPASIEDHVRAGQNVRRHCLSFLQADHLGHGHDVAPTVGRFIDRRGMVEALWRAIRTRASVFLGAYGLRQPKVADVTRWTNN